MKAKKFTFKTEKDTGRYRAFYAHTHYIKFNKKDVGQIYSLDGYNGGPFKIQLRVIKKDIMEDGNPNCIWRNIILKKELATLPEAKEWLNANIDLILSKYELHMKD